MGEVQRSWKVTAKRTRITPKHRVEVIGDCTLYLGDCRDILPILDVVDVVITAPPYPSEFRVMVKDVLCNCGDVVKDGGSIIAMLGQSYLPEMLTIVPNGCQFHWLSCYLTLGGQSAQLWQKNVNSFWKPLLWFVKGEYNGKWVGDVCKSPANDKDHHHWGQSVGGIRALVDKHSEVGNVVLDPFMGAGTTGVACIQLERKFIGVEVEPAHFDSARRRIEEEYRRPNFFIKRPKLPPATFLPPRPK